MNQASSPVFFPVSIRKFVVMSTVTLGFYQIFWFHKNWQLIKSKEGSKIMPIWRAIFGIFFIYSLIEKIKKSANSSNVSTNYNSTLIVMIWIIVRILSRFSSEFLPLLIDILVDFMFALVLIPVQKAANNLNLAIAPRHDRNDRFSGWNIAAIVVWVFYFSSAVNEIALPLIWGK